MAENRLVEKTMTVEQAGKLLRIGRNTAYEAVRSGQIPSIKIGKRLLVPIAAMNQLLQSPTFHAPRASKQTLMIAHEREHHLMARPRPKYAATKIRIPPRLHQALTERARRQGLSLNTLMLELLYAGAFDGG